MTVTKTILKEGFATAWRNKKLWLFGLFVSVFGVAGEIEILFQSNQVGTPGVTRQFFETLQSTGLLSFSGIKGTLKALKAEPLQFLQIILVLAFIAFMVAITLWVISICHGAMVHAVTSVQAKKRAKVGLSVRVGIKKFWPVFWLLFLTKIFFAFLFFILGILVPQNIILFVVAYNIILLVIIFFSMIVKYAAGAIVTQNLGFFEGVREGFAIFSENKAKSLLLAFVLFLINAAVIALLLLLIFLVLTPFFLILGTTILFQAGTAFIFNVYLASLAIFGIIMLVASFMATFHWACWMKMFAVITGEQKN